MNICRKCDGANLAQIGNQGGIGSTLPLGRYLHTASDSRLFSGNGIAPLHGRYRLLELAVKYFDLAQHDEEPFADPQFQIGIDGLAVGVIVVEANPAEDWLFAQTDYTRLRTNPSSRFR